MKLQLLSLLGITRAQLPEAFSQNGKCEGEYYRIELQNSFDFFKHSRIT